MAEPMDYASRLLGLAGERQPALQQVQSPDPAPRPAAPQNQGPSYADRLLGTAPAEPIAAPKVGTVDPLAEPDAPGFWGRRLQDIRGRQDPRYKDLPAYDPGSDQAAQSALAQAKVLGPDDEGLGNIIKGQLGDRFVGLKEDANGYPIVTYRGEDGSEQSAYVNRPGLDGQDVDRSISAAIPYVAAATGVGRLVRGAGVMRQSIAQALAAGGTSLATDAAANAIGSDQGVSLGKAGVAAVAGGVGQAIAHPIDALVRRFVVEPSLFNRATRTLTERGAAVAKRLGIEPDDLSGKIGEEFARTYAKTGSAAQAQVHAQTRGQFDIPTTVGQRTKDPQALMNEKNMRYGVYGDAAKQTMTDFDRTQQSAIRDAAIGGTKPISGSRIPAEEATGIAPQLAPLRYRAQPDEVGSAIKESLQGAKAGARQAESEAWKGVSDITPKPEAFDLLPNAIGNRLGSLRVDDKLTPKAFAMAQDLDGYVAGKALTEGGPKVLGQTPVRTLDEMRRRLLATYRGTAEATDRAAAKGIYDGFNDWLSEAASKALINGDAKAAAQMRVARDVTRQIKDAFSPTGPDGKKTAGAALIERLFKADSGEGIVATLFGPNPVTSQPKQGAVEALGRIKQSFDAYLPKEVAKAAWADVKLANWLRLVQDKRGEVFSPQVMLNNLRGALANQPTLMKALYSPNELKIMRQFTGALARAAYKDPNPSGTASGVGVMGRELGTTIITAMGYQNGALSKMVQLLLGISGINRAAGGVAARTATSQAQGTSVRVPALGGISAGAVTPAGQ
jgi:hypothetical protein